MSSGGGFSLDDTLEMATQVPSKKRCRSQPLKFPSAAHVLFSIPQPAGQPPVASVRKGTKERINGCGVLGFVLYKRYKMEYALLFRVSVRKIP